MAVTTSKPRAASRPADDLYLSGVHTATLRMENLAAGADITERVFFRAKYPIVLLEAEILPEAASTGIDGSNTLLVTVQNITGAAAMATITRTTDLVANTPVALTVSTTIANTKAAADDVIGIIVTQGTTADAAVFAVQITYRADTV